MGNGNAPRGAVMKRRAAARKAAQKEERGMEA